MTHATIARGALIAATLVLAACAPQRQSLRPASLPDDRAARVAALPAWQLDGRIAVSDGKDGGSGRIRWERDATRYRITVRAPISNDTWTLAGDADGVVLEGGRRGAVRGRDAQALLARELGWHLPVDAVQHWILGAAHDPRRATIERDDEGRPRVLREGGWTVEFRAWTDATGDVPAMPRRIVARRAPHEVRLAVADWRFDAP